MNPDKLDDLTEQLNRFQCLETEEEWHHAASTVPMFGYLKGYLNRQTSGCERKVRLFACACVRGLWHLCDAVGRGAVATAERFVDGQANGDELHSAYVGVSSRNLRFVEPDEMSAVQLMAEAATWAALAQRIPENEPTVHSLEDLLDPPPFRPNRYEISWAEEASDCVLQVRTDAKAEESHADLLREIFGNPFRPVTVDPEWRTPTVMQLARGIYDSRNFGDLPILADALQDAGCDCDDILNHFRDASATHVRGCWALDLVLGKE